MATTTTYSLIKGTVGGDEDSWGADINTNWDDIDDLLDGTTVVTGIKMDDTLSVVDNSDNTKVAQFQASGITTSTTRTFTFPDASGTLVLEGGTQTLTNKTLTSPTIGTSFTFDSITVDALNDEDDMSSDSATALATQQSIKAYVDSTATDTGTTNGTSAASTSGTAVDFTSIPSTAKRIRIMFGGVSTNGSSVVGVQIGDSGGFLNSGYLAAAGDIVGAAAANFTTFFGTQSSGGALHVRHGMIELNNITGNQWSCTGTLALSNAGQVFVCGGTATLSGTLDRVRVTTANGTDTFDAGNINISWEG